MSATEQFLKLCREQPDRWCPINIPSDQKCGYYCGRFEIEPTPGVLEELEEFCGLRGYLTGHELGRIEKIEHKQILDELKKFKLKLYNKTK